ncbi:MAG: hypothetical protein O2894_06600 [Planctomycetota bacterium]|nr:hypothetical protein [Planctomycetota bacterium]
MANLSEKQLLVLTISVAILLTGGLLFLVYQDRTEVETIESEISGLDSRLQTAEMEVRKIPTREDKVLQFRAVEPRELAVLPTEQHIADFHRQLSGFLSTAGMKFQELPESSPEDSELAKGIRVTRNRIKGLGDANAILKFINSIENDPRLVAVKGYKVQAGEPDRDDPEATIIHEVEIELETYHYRPGKASINREHIPGGEERLQDPKMRATIAAFQPERPDTYVLRPAVGRRDPFVDPRRAREFIDPDAERAEFEAQEKIVVELESSYRDVTEILEKEKALESAGDLFRLDRIRREIDDKINNLRARVEQVSVTKAVSVTALQARIDVLDENLGRVRTSRAPKEVVVTRIVAEKVIEEIREKFESGKYAEIDSLGQSWVSFLRGKEVMPEAQPVLEEIRLLRDRAKVLAEFGVMTFKIGGRIVDRENPARSVVQINGKYLRVGDPIDGKGLVRLLEIGLDSVAFGYKDETIRRGVDSDGRGSK